MRWFRRSTHGITDDELRLANRVWWIDGYEFDWFAVDSAGDIGHFSTAGHGPIPLPIYERLDEARSDAVWSLYDRLLELPEVGRATEHLTGTIDDWLEMARRGLYAFDWQHWSGPYRLAATPRTPIEVTAIPDELRDLLLLVEWPEIEFSVMSSVRPETLCLCR